MFTLRGIRECAIITWMGGGGGGWEMGKIRLKIKSHHPLTKQKLTLFNPPHPLIILRSSPPPPPASPSHWYPHVLDVFLSRGHKKVLQRMYSLHRKHLTQILKLFHLHTSYYILHLLFHHWQHFNLTTRLVKSALPNSTVGFSILFNYNSM